MNDHRLLSIAIATIGAVFIVVYLLMGAAVEGFRALINRLAGK